MKSYSLYQPPPRFRWPDDSKCCVMLCFDVDGETTALSEDPTLKNRLTTYSQTTYGPSIGVPRLLGLLKYLNVPATFFVPGYIAEQHLRMMEAIVAGGMLLLPLGATEQHGPHLPINTDTLIAESVCWYASAKTNVPVLPALTYTVSVGHTTKWPGTFSLAHETFIASLRQIAAWSAATGWKRLLLINSHFGNDASMRVAVDQIRLAHLGSLQIAGKNTFNLSTSIRNYFIGDAEDLHANQAETDLLLFLAPELVRVEKMQDDPDRTAERLFSYPVAQTSLNGVTGSPSQATVKQGERLFREIGDTLTLLIERAKEETPPLGSDYWRELPRLNPDFFLEAFEADPLIDQVFGTEFKEIYLKQKLKEWDEGFYPISEAHLQKHLTFI